MLKDSKRFPGKNTYPFMGVPLYMHTVNFASLFDMPYIIMHNYPSLYLPTFVKQYGRGPNKENSSAEILSLNLDWEVYVLLQVTSPLRDANLFAEALHMFIASGKLCACTVRTLKDKYMRMQNVPINFTQGARTYDGCIRADIAYETGSFFFFRREQLHKCHIMDATPNETMLIEDNYALDIDYQSDIHKIEERIKLCV